MGRNEILGRLRERIIAFAASRTSRDAAEDLAQEVLLVLEQKYSSVTALEELVPLSFQIMRFKMAGLRRKKARGAAVGTVSVDELPLQDPRPGPAEEAERREMTERLAAAITMLGPRCREILRLKLEGLSFPEIQRKLRAASINTVYTWDARCRKELLGRMGGRWEREN